MRTDRCDGRKTLRDAHHNSVVYGREDRKRLATLPIWFSIRRLGGALWPPREAFFGKVRWVAERQAGWLGIGAGYCSASTVLTDPTGGALWPPRKAFFFSRRSTVGGWETGGLAWHRRSLPLSEYRTLWSDRWRTLAVQEKAHVDCYFYIPYIHTWNNSFWNMYNTYAVCWRV